MLIEAQRVTGSKKKKNVFQRLAVDGDDIKNTVIQSRVTCLFRGGKLQSEFLKFLE